MKDKTILYKDYSENIAKEPVQYRMNVHLVNALFLPGCVNFRLRKIADDYESEFSSDANTFLRKGF